jgi:hypothetical protein
MILYKKNIIEENINNNKARKKETVLWYLNILKLIILIEANNIETIKHIIPEK